MLKKFSIVISAVLGLFAGLGFMPTTSAKTSDVRMPQTLPQTLNIASPEQPIVQSTEAAAEQMVARRRPRRRQGQIVPCPACGMG